MKTFYDIDFMLPEQIREIQGQLLSETLAIAYERSACYRDLYNSMPGGVGGVKGIEDIVRLPLTSREDVQRRNEDFFAAGRRELAEIVSTSGTTGKPVYVAMTAGDLERLAYNEEKSFANAGAARDDLFLIDVTCDSLFIAGIAYYSGLLRLGSAVVRCGPRSMERQLALIRKLRPSGIVAVPSFMVRLAEHALAHDNDDIFGMIEKIVLIGDSVRNDDYSLNPLGRLIERSYGDIFYSTYGITEGQVSFCECREKHGLHSHPDLVIAEIIDETGNPLPDGTTGELVITTLQIEGMPLIRYRTGDITFKMSSPCACGRNSVRIGPVLGRRDHRLKIKGVTLYPTTIMNALMEMEEVVNYQIEAYTGDDCSDALCVRVGACNHNGDFRKKLTDMIRARARVVPDIEIMGPDVLSDMLFHGGSRKPRTFIDNREKTYEQKD